MMLWVKTNINKMCTKYLYPNRKLFIQIGNYFTTCTNYLFIKVANYHIKLKPKPKPRLVKHIRIQNVTANKIKLHMTLPHSLNLTSMYVLHTYCITLSNRYKAYIRFIKHLRLWNPPSPAKVAIQCRATSMGRL